MKSLTYSTFLITIFLVPAFASAATISLQAQPATVGVGETVQVTLLINSNVLTNAFAGTLVFPQNLLTPVAVSDGNSIVNIWITHPKIGTGTIMFAGVTPGGFSGRKGVLFKTLFRTKSAAHARLSLINVQVLRNDGAGTPEPVTVTPIAIAIEQASRATFVEPKVATPPEPFKLYLGRIPQLFENKYFLAFSAVDKNSGIDYYEVAETRWPQWLVTPVWNKTKSPYVIRDQYLTSDVLVKAVDYAGNERVSIFPRKHLLRPYEWLILGAVLFAACMLGYRYRRRETSYQSHP